MASSTLAAILNYLLGVGFILAAIFPGRVRRYVLLGAAALFLLSLLSAFTQVQPGEIAVVRRFGRVLEDRPGPGLYVGLPWGMDQVDRVEVDKVRRITVGYTGIESESEANPPGQLLTGDHNLVNIAIVIDYKVNPERVVDFVVQGDRVEPLIERAAETALAEWVAGRRVDDVLLGGKLALPAWLVQRTQERIESYGLGVQITDAGVTLLSPPAEVKAAFEEVTRAETAIGQQMNRARQKAEEGWQTALAEKYRIERETAAYAREQRLMAEAEAANFEERLAQYRRLSKDNPSYLVALWWDEMSRLYARMRANGRIDLLDNRLGADGLDITQVPLLPRNK
jgi:membrane protease subunit HflK